MKEDNPHIVEYLILFSGLLLCFVFFILFRFNTTVQIIISFVGSVFYVLWGIIHHAIEERLSKFVVLEYALIGLFVFSLLFVVIGM